MFLKNRHEGSGKSHDSAKVWRYPRNRRDFDQCFTLVEQEPENNKRGERKEKLSDTMAALITGKPTFHSSAPPNLKNCTRASVPFALMLVYGPGCLRWCTLASCALLWRSVRVKPSLSRDETVPSRMTSRVSRTCFFWFSRKIFSLVSRSNRELQAYFDNTYDIDETLFTGITGMFLRPCYFPIHGLCDHDASSITDVPV